MAKTQPTPAPVLDPVPPAPDSEVKVTPPPSTEPEVVKSRHPQGVTMHDAGALPYTADRDKRLATAEPQAAPPGWKGTYRSCGGCGAFLGNEDRCPKCAPASALPNVFNVGPKGEV